MTSKGKVTYVCPGVTLTTVRKDEPLTIDYFVEVAKLKVVTFKMDFTGSENMRLAASDEDGGLVATTDIQPFDRRKVASLSRADAAAGCSWRYSYSLTFAEPDEALIRDYVRKDSEKIDHMIGLAKSLDLGADSATPADLIARCKENGIHFLDTDFPPSGAALVPADAPSSLDVSHITWRRPDQFFKPDSEDAAAADALPFDVFVGKIEPQDIRQGQLSDCWFLCALSALAENPSNVDRIFVVDDATSSSRSGRRAGAGSGSGGGAAATSVAFKVHANPEGVYCVRFYKHGRPVDVKVDDYFPCVPCGGPVYAKGHANELWVLILEKAYAKIHGSYNSLRLGYTHEALLDLTGCPTKVYRLDGQVEAELVASGQFWAMLERYDELHCLLTCDTPGTDVHTEAGTEPHGTFGLCKGHAYALIAVRTLSTGARLLQIRNPWGRMEWTGDWSDSSDLWTPELRAEAGCVEAKDDGLFWMGYEDFLKYFVRVVVCRLKTVAADDWHVHRLKGSFVRQRTAYGVSPITTSTFRLTVPRDAEVVIGLHQTDVRSRGGQPYIDAGVTVLQETSPGKFRLVACSGLEVDRQLQLQADIPAGEYLVVPRTTGCKLDIADITGPKDKVKLYDAAKKAFTDDCIIALEAVFDRFDADLDGVLARPEMNKFQQLTDGCDMGDEEYRFLCQYFDNRDGCLTRDGFIAAYKYIFDSRGCDVDMLMTELRSLGFNEQLELVDSRSYVLSVHVDTSGATLDEVAFDPEMYEEAMELPIIKHGKATEYADGMIVVYSQMSDHGGLSFALQNKTTFRGVFTMDMSSGGENVMSHQGSMLAEVAVEPGETEILHHLMAVETDKPCRMPGYSLSWSWQVAK